VALGDGAFDEMSLVLADATRPRKLRVALPNAMARFGTKLAAERLLAIIERDPDRLVQYKALRALGRLVAQHRVRVSRVRLEGLSYANLVAHLEMLDLRVGLDAPLATAPADAKGHALTGRLLRGLLDDKLRHSLERAFRLLQAAHPGEDIHRAYIACLSTDGRAKANAGELLDTLLMKRDQQRLREVLRLVADDLTPAQRAARAGAYLSVQSPQSPEDSLVELVEDRDVVVAALATLHAYATGTSRVVAAADAARARRVEIERTARLFLDRSARSWREPTVAHAG
jgi:hypothetical protein